jgi:hypothetical protein
MDHRRHRLPEKGEHSVGGSHQYRGQLGEQAYRQVAVTLSLANHDASLPVAYRLHLPKAWAEDDARRRKVKVHEDITLKTKPEIALDLVRWAHDIGLPGKYGGPWIQSEMRTATSFAIDTDPKSCFKWGRHAMYPPAYSPGNRFRQRCWGDAKKRLRQREPPGQSKVGRYVSSARAQRCGTARARPV